MRVLRKIERATLRERFQGLKATASRLIPLRRRLPEANSEEARTMFAAACRESTRLSVRGLQGFPDLKRTSLEWWTTDSLERAVERGELPAAEAAPLYARAAQRELIFYRAAAATNVGALNLLAFADEYPHPAGGDDIEAEPDPIFAAIRDERQWEAVNAPGLDDEEAARLSDAHDAPWEAMLATRPATMPGLLALMRAISSGGGHAFDTAEALTWMRMAADHLSRLIDMGGDVDPAVALVDAIEREWAIWARAELADLNATDAEADARDEARQVRRYQLLEAAERLPANTRAARHAKALAEAWVEWIAQETPGQKREDYVQIERYAFDIHHALMAGDLTADPDAELIALGREWGAAREIEAEAWRAWNSAAGGDDEPAAKAEAQRLNAKAVEIGKRACAMPATTLAGLAVKARMVSAFCGADPVGELERMRPEDPETAGVHLAIDVLRMVGDLPGSGR